MGMATRHCSKDVQRVPLEKQLSGNTVTFFLWADRQLSFEGCSGVASHFTGAASELFFGWPSPSSFPKETKAQKDRRFFVLVADFRTDCSPPPRNLKGISGPVASKETLARFHVAMFPFALPHRHMANRRTFFVELEDFTAAMDAVNVDLDEMRARVDAA